VSEILGIRENAGEVPGIAWAYWSMVRLTSVESWGMYGMEERRTNLHDDLCKHYGMDRETTKQVTDHLDRYECAVDMHDALVAMKVNNNELAKGGKR